MPKTRVGTQARAGPQAVHARASARRWPGASATTRPTGSKAAARERPPTRAAKQRTSTGETVTDPVHACSGAGGTPGFGPTRDQLADGHTKLSKASLLLPHPAPRGALDGDHGGGHRWLHVPHDGPPNVERATRGLHRRTPEPSPPGDRCQHVADLHKCANSQVRRPVLPGKSGKISTRIGVSRWTRRAFSRCARRAAVRRPFPSRSSPPPAGPGRPLRRVRRRSAHPARRRGPRSPSPGCACPPGPAWR